MIDTRNRYGAFDLCDDDADQAGFPVLAEKIDGKVEAKAHVGRMPKGISQRKKRQAVETGLQDGDELVDLDVESDPNAHLIRKVCGPGFKEVMHANSRTAKSGMQREFGSQPIKPDRNVITSTSSAGNHGDNHAKITHSASVPLLNCRGKDASDLNENVEKDFADEVVVEGETNCDSCSSGDDCPCDASIFGSDSEEDADAQRFLPESHLNFREGTFVDRKFMKSAKNVSSKFRQNIIEHGENITRKTAEEIKSHAETIPVSPMFLVLAQEAKCADDC